jgi:hypothetical protein
MRWNLNDESKKANWGKSEVKRATPLKLQEPEKNNFAGKGFVRINGRSFPGVAEFSSIVKTNNRGYLSVKNAAVVIMVILPAMKRT